MQKFKDVRIRLSLEQHNILRNKLAISRHKTFASFIRDKVFNSPNIEKMIGDLHKKICPRVKNE